MGELSSQLKGSFVPVNRVGMEISGEQDVDRSIAREELNWFSAQCAVGCALELKTSTLPSMA